MSGYSYARVAHNVGPPETCIDPASSNANFRSFVSFMLTLNKKQDSTQTKLGVSSWKQS